MRRTGGHGWPPRACAQQGLRSAMPTASRFLRSFRAHSGHYVSERITKRCRCGAAAAGASLVRQAPLLGAVLGAKLEMREPLRIARSTADFAFTLDARQTLPRIENHPAPLVELMLEQRQQRALAGRLDAIRRE